MKATISKTFEFCAAHCLTGVSDDHPCHRLHGHTWKVTIEVRGEVDPLSGFVLDFRVLGDAVKPMIERLDHHNLNDYFENPTCENIAAAFVQELRGTIRNLYAVEICESERTKCRVENFDV